MTPTSFPPLPAAWIDKIFERMQGMYGRLWLDRWRNEELDSEGKDMGLQNAKKVWAEELAGFAEQPERLAQALKICRYRPMPPTLPEFAALARHVAMPALPRLAAPKPDPSKARNRAAECAAAFAAIAVGPTNPKAWALKIIENPEKYPSASRRIALEALGDDL